MNPASKIYTVDSTSEYKLKEKGSVFLCIAMHANNETEIAKILNDLRKKYYDATHHCYAYKISNGKTKYSDDGEPNGTAGIRIFNAINHFELTDILVLVIRYFGGTKLGVGPLGKAYYDCSLQCLQNAQKVSKTLYCRVIISYPFEFSNFIHRILSKYSAKIEESTYTDSPKIKALLPFNDADSFFEELNSGSNSIIKAFDTGEIEYIL